jgi:nucleoside-diphosphate-sugar epimerase
VVTTVRSHGKGLGILAKFPGMPSSRLSFVVVENIARPGAFDEAIVTDPPFDAVVHTASPFHYNITDVKLDLLDPAILGTTGMLRSIKRFAPTVRRVVITSSFAAMVVPDAHPDVYDETAWNPVTAEEAEKDAVTAYRASKTLAERAAWDFLSTEKPAFTITTINPPNVFGPLARYPGMGVAVNTSNQRIYDMMERNMVHGLEATGSFLWVDVRDVALAHVRAMEREEAAGKRFLVTAGHFANSDIANIIKEEFPDKARNLPNEVTSDMPENVYGFNNRLSTSLLGLRYRTFRECLVETMASLMDIPV